MNKKQTALVFPLSRLAVSLAALCAVAGVQAVEEDIFFSEMPIVASVSRLPQRLADAPTAVTVLDREIIKASGVRDLSDVLRLVPGFQTFPNNTEAARVSYHGLNDEEYSPRIQVLIDGQSQYSPLFRSGVNWLTIPVAIEDIERIEVVRGSNNVAYGNNSFAGVINIITVDPALVRGVSVSANAGNQDVRDVTVRGGGKIGDVGDFRVTYQQKSDDGIRDRADWVDFSSTRLLDARANFNLGNRDVLELRGGRSEGTMNQGRWKRDGTVYLIGIDSPENPMRDFDQASTYMQINWMRSLDGDSEFSLQYGFREDWASEKHTETFNTSFLDTKGIATPMLVEGNTLGGRSRTHELEMEHRFRATPDLRVSWGAGWRLESIDAPAFFYDQGVVRRDVERLFGSLEWRPMHWLTGNAGVSVDRDSLGGTHASPRASANFHLTPENTLRLGYSIAHRTGSIHDYKGDRRNVPYQTVAGAAIDEGSIYRRRFYGDENIEAEKLKTLELGFLGDWKAQRASLDVRLFDERVPKRWMQLDYEYLDCPANPLCQDTSMSNVPLTSSTRFTSTIPVQDVHTRGIEYQLRWQPLDDTRLMLSQAFVQTDVEMILNVDNRGVLIPGQLKLPNLAVLNSSEYERTQKLTEDSAPSHSTSLLLMQKLPYGVEFSLVGYWVGNQKWSRNTEALSYHRFDGRLGYKFRIGNVGGELAYTAQNIDSTHGEYKAGLNDPTARMFEPRHWLTVRMDL